MRPLELGAADAVAEAEARYNARLAVPHWRQTFARWAAESAKVRRHAACLLNVRYGEDAMQALDLFLPAGPPRGTLLYVHGGYWRSLDKSDASIVAPPFTAAGYQVAVINYALCPLASMDRIADQVRDAAVWLHEGSARPLFVCGHSSGAHLATLLLATDWPARDDRLPTRLVRAAIGISGLYDLRPLCDVPSVAEPTRLTPALAARLSPALLAPTSDAPLLTAMGLSENEGFQAQAALIAAKWRHVYAGQVACPGHDHFSILDELCADDGAIARAALRLMQSMTH